MNLLLPSIKIKVVLDLDVLRNESAIFDSRKEPYAARRLDCFFRESVGQPRYHYDVIDLTAPMKDRS